MKKLMVAVAIMIVGLTLFGSTASAHSLIVTGTSSCVREDGTWDWSASYSIPNEPWAQGLTVVVTWSPSSSGTSSDAFVWVSANGVFSNGVHGGGSTKIHRGEKCQEETEKTTTTVAETTTTTTVPEATTTTVPTVGTTTTVPTEVVTGMPTDTPTVVVIDTPEVVEEEPAPTTTIMTTLPATGKTSNGIVVAAIAAVVVGTILMCIKHVRRNS
jgi:hypothetical protein